VGKIVNIYLIKKVLYLFLNELIEVKILSLFVFSNMKENFHRLRRLLIPLLKLHE